MSVFSKYKDILLDKILERKEDKLKFPLDKLGNNINNYSSGDFIAIGGRKTSGKSYFVLHNYVINPIIQRMAKKKVGIVIDLKVIYISTRYSLKHTMDRMVVNYISQMSGGNKVSIPSIYGYTGNHAKLLPEDAKNVFSSTFDIFDAFVNKGMLNVIAGQKSMLEINSFIRTAMEELGEFDDDDDFIYSKNKKDTKVIIVIDDVSNIAKESLNSSSFETAIQIANNLRDIAKSYEATVVATVPTISSYKRDKTHRSSIADISPYGSVCDRGIVLHNPVETDDFRFLDYDIQDFINQKTGACYFRSAFIAANFMGASGVYIPLFIMPENGYFDELPSSAEEFELEIFKDKI
jgi:hypothetical protein